MASKSLIQRHKTRARLLLYGLPVLIFLALSWLSRKPEILVSDRSWQDIDFLEFESVRHFQEYLRIDTSYPEGSEIAGAEFLASLFEAEGIPAHVERLGERNANMWAELPGKNPRALVLHNHIDVIPPLKIDKWRFPPFSGAIEKPFIYGRGAFDMKSLAIAQAMAMIELKRSGVELERSLLFLATGEEERDSWLGTQRILKLHPELRDRFWAVLTEGGAIEAVSVEDARYWGTEFHQKQFIDIWVCDADAKRLEYLRRDIHKRRMPRRVTPPLKDFFLRYGPSRDREATRKMLADPDQLLDRIRTYPKEVDVTVITPNIEQMMRSTAVVFPIEEDPEGGYKMRIILHLHADENPEDVWDGLLEDNLTGFTYQVETMYEPSGGSPLDHEVFKGIEEFMARERPEIDHGPLSIPFSATDARFFRSYGIPTYGFTPFHIISSDTGGMKGVDERMALPSFVQGVDIYSNLVRDLVTETQP